MQPVNTKENLKNIVEAVLFASAEPLTVNDILKAFEGENNVGKKEVREAVDALNVEYGASGRPFLVEEVAGGFRMITRPEYAEYIKRIYQSQPSRLSKPALETLAIVAYRQPIIKADIESIRGVNVDGVIKSLLDKNLIRISGRKDVVGRPFEFSTTEKFLEYFGLTNIKELPRIEELKQFSSLK
ncbi:MAG: SMC-Scp complex subunit ScpB [Candidatus Aureabacteria bacterium]|nr:SMC-Scp complex subunit ScpB [Candidatus Auribacterota bacterium]